MNLPLRGSAWLLLLVLGNPLHAQNVTLPEVSPKATVEQTIGITEVKVVYHRPAVNKREIWGKLEPWGYVYRNFGTSHQAPWRAGANENTLVSFQHDVRVAGQPLPAGTYGLFMALNPSGVVTVIFSKDTGHWGSFYYEPAHDALRVDVPWEDAPFHELLIYDFTDVTKNSAILALSWEKKRIPIPLQVDTDRIVVASLQNEMQSAKGFRYQSGVDASQYLLANNLELPLALHWAQFAVSDPVFGERNFTTLSNQVQVLEKMGRADEAKPIMDEALKIGSVTQIHQYGRQLLAQKKAERALEVFKLNAELHPHVWPVDYGLARGYSAVGNYPAALAALQAAQKALPPGDTVNAGAIEVNLAKLQRGENIN